MIYYMDSSIYYISKFLDRLLCKSHGICSILVTKQTMATYNQEMTDSEKMTVTFIIAIAFIMTSLIVFEECKRSPRRYISYFPLEKDTPKVLDQRLNFMSFKACENYKKKGPVVLPTDQQLKSYIPNAPEKFTFFDRQLLKNDDETYRYYVRDCEGKLIGKGLLFHSDGLVNRLCEEGAYIRDGWKISVKL